jgi:hypothetical protein
MPLNCGLSKKITALATLGFLGEVKAMAEDKRTQSEQVDAAIASICDDLQSRVNDPLWPLKMFRGWRSESPKYPKGDTFSKIFQFGFSARGFDHEDVIIFMVFADEGRILAQRLLGGLSFILTTPDKEEILARYPDALEKAKATPYIYGWDEGKLNRQLPKEVFGIFYATKLRNIIERQSHLCFLHDEGAITEQEYEKGIAKCTKELDRWGFNGLAKMVEATPALRDFLLQDTTTTNYDSIPNAPHIPKTRPFNIPGAPHTPETRAEYLKYELAFDKEQRKKNPNFNPLHLEEAYQRALSGGASSLGHAVQKAEVIQQWLGNYQEHHEKLETPNAQLHLAMKSTDAETRREAERTFIIKHSLTILDFDFTKEYPQFEKLQRRLMNRMREELPLTKDREKTIEELFAKPVLPSYRNPHVMESEAEVVENELLALSSDTQMKERSQESRKKRDSSAEKPQESDNSISSSKNESASGIDGGRENSSPPPPPSPPEPPVNEKMPEEESPTKESSSPSNKFLLAGAGLALAGMVGASLSDEKKQPVDKEKTEETPAQEPPSRSKKLLFVTSAVAFLGTVGWFVFNLMQENKHKQTTQKSFHHKG